jgi:hypothetical protein
VVSRPARPAASRMGRPDRRPGRGRQPGHLADDCDGPCARPAGTESGSLAQAGVASRSSPRLCLTQTYGARAAPTALLSAQRGHAVDTRRCSWRKGSRALATDHTPPSPTDRALPLHAVWVTPACWPLSTSIGRERSIESSAEECNLHLRELRARIAQSRSEGARHVRRRSERLDHRCRGGAA